MNISLPITVENLYPLIGTRVRFLGLTYQVVDVVDDDGPLLILEDCAGTSIQSDQYGDPQCRVPTLVSLPVLGAGGHALHPDFESLESV
jgi:hypothetical protein